MTDEMLTTAPPSPSSMIGTAARVRAWAVVTLKWNASSRYRVDVFMNALGIVPPTLLITTSRRPNDWRAGGARAGTASATGRGAGTASRLPVRGVVAESSGRGWSVRRSQRAATAGSLGVLADPGVHGDARRDARVDRAGGTEHGDRAHLRAGVAGGRRQAGTLLAEEQHAPAGKPGRLERHRSRQVVDADDRQPGAGGPIQQVRNVGVVDDVLVEVGDHRSAPVPP